MSEPTCNNILKPNVSKRKAFAPAFNRKPFRDNVHLLGGQLHIVYIDLLLSLAHNRNQSRNLVKNSSSYTGSSGMM